MRSSFTAAVLCTLGLSLAGCAAESASEEGALEGDVGATNEAVAATGQSTFYRVVRQDFRKCAWPLCGGVYVARVNRTESLCADGKWASECYVAEFDWKALGLADSATFDAKVRAGSALVRGKIESRTTGPVTASTFVASEGWEARIEGATATGYFSRLTQRAVKCASPACVSFDLSYLNLSTSRPVNTFATKALPTDLVPELNAALADGKIGVLVAGDTYLSAGRRTFVPSQVYTQPKVGGVDGARCGGRGTGPCADGYFCSWSAGANCGRADASGTCTKRPEICTEIYKPVCGCDGKTYGNACAAASAGVSVETAGACGGAAGATCGGLLGKGCQDGLFCDYPIGTMCGATDMTGICTEPTTICTKEYAPVCGCDGKTYGNACMARSASVSAVSKGACK